MPPFTYESLKTLVSSSRCPRASHCVGITTFISQELMRGIKYARPRTPTRRRTKPAKPSVVAKAGLRLGRRLDSSFRQYAAGAGCGSARMLAPVLRSLKRRSIRVVCAQTPVSIASLKLRTELDGLGIDQHGRPWVIELKNTQMTVADHSAAYDLPCPNNVTLSNGLPNTERVRHSLQAGFGLLAFSRNYRVRVSDISAIVVVNCVDGCVSHTVDPSVYSIPSVFVSPTPPASSTQWDPTSRDLIAAVQRLGYSTHVKTSCGGRVGVYTRVDGTTTHKLAIGIGTAQTRWVKSIRTATERIVLVDVGLTTLCARRV